MDDYNDIIRDEPYIHSTEYRDLAFELEVSRRMIADLAEQHYGALGEHRAQRIRRVRSIEERLSAIRTEIDASHFPLCSDTHHGKEYTFRMVNEDDGPEAETKAIVDLCFDRVTLVLRLCLALLIWSALKLVCSDFGAYQIPMQCVLVFYGLGLNKSDIDLVLTTIRSWWTAPLPALWFLCVGLKRLCDNEMDLWRRAARLDVRMRGFPPHASYRRAGLDQVEDKNHVTVGLAITF